MFNIPKALRTILRILTFRAAREELKENVAALLVTALIITWIVGIGRWWDDPRDLPIFVRMGVGSVLYVFGMAAILWVTFAPFVAEKLGARHFVAFVASTSLPGLVYAVPIEQWTDLDTAATYNVFALLFVSVYRVSLLLWFCRRVNKLNWTESVVVTFLPISVIAFALTALGHAASVMDIMGGLRDRMSKSDMEMIVGLIGCLSIVLGPILIIIYIAMASHAQYLRKKLGP